MIGERLIFILTIVTLLYVSFAFYKSNHPKAYILSILYFLPFMNFLATKESMGGLKTFDLLSIVSFFYLLKYFFVDNYARKKHILLYLFLALIITSIIGSLLSENKSSSLLSIIKIFPIFIFSRFLLLECIQDSQFHYKIVKVLKFSFIIAIGFLFMQWMVGLKFSFYSILNPNTFDPLRNAIRYPGYFNDTQAQGQFLAMGSFLFLYFRPDIPKKEKLLNYFFFVAAVAAIIMSGSRSALAGFSIGLVVVILIIGKKYSIYIFILLLSIQSILTFVPSTFGVFSRTENFGEDLDFRKSLWREAYKIFEAHPLFGIGTGNYQSYIKLNNPDQYLEVNDEILYFDQPENGYLKVLVETGIIGFIIFVLIIIYPLFSAVKLYLSRRCDFGIIYLTASLITWLIAFNTVYSLFDNRILIMVATVAVLIISYPIKSTIVKDGNEAGIS